MLNFISRQTEREIWRVGNDVAGYSKEVRNLKVVMVRNSGHMVPLDQPLWALDMIYQFVKEKPLPTPTSTVALTTLTTSAAEITLGSKLMTIMICFFSTKSFKMLSGTCSWTT